MKFKELSDFYEIFAMHESMPDVVKNRIETKLSKESKFWRAIFKG